MSPFFLHYDTRTLSRYLRYSLTHVSVLRQADHDKYFLLKYMNECRFKTIIKDPNVYMAFITSMNFDKGFFNSYLVNFDCTVTEYLCETFHKQTLYEVNEMMKTFAIPNPKCYDDPCVICYENKAIMQLNCKHITCIPCSLRVNKCPFCRSEILDRKIVD